MHKTIAISNFSKTSDFALDLTDLVEIAENET